MGDIPDMPAEADLLKGRPSRARYDKVHLALERKWRRRELRPERMMREVVDALWDSFAQSPYCWCGFYLLSADAAVLILGPHRDHPRASPLPRQGLCGRALNEGRAFIASDAGVLGEAQPGPEARRVCEIALPVFDKAGKAWAVFYAESLARGVFDEMDQRWLEKILKHFQSVGAPESGRQ